MNKPEHHSGSRSLARERALQALYQVDIAEADPAEALRVAWASSDESSKPDFAGFDFAESLVHGVISRKDELDAAIGKSSHNWRVDRMSRIDRNIIRIAAYELMQENPLPASIVLNEAIELAKRFGSVESRSFINGVLDCMVKASEGRQQKKD